MLSTARWKHSPLRVFGSPSFLRLYLRVGLTGRWSPLGSPSPGPEPRPRWCTAATPRRASRPELSARTSCCRWRSRRRAAGRDPAASWPRPAGGREGNRTTWRWRRRAPSKMALLLVKVGFLATISEGLSEYLEILYVVIWRHTNKTEGKCSCRHNREPCPRADLFYKQ